MKKSGSGFVKGALKYLLGFGLLGYVIARYWEGLKELFQREPNLLNLLAVVIIVLVSVALQYYRWYLLVRAVDLPFTVRDSVRLGLVGTFYNTFLPGSVGGDLVKAYFIAKGQPGRRATAVATVIADRLIGLFGLILYAGLVGGAFWLANDSKIVENDYLKTVIRVCLSIVGSTVLFWLLLGFLPQHRADRFAGRLLKLPKVGKTAAELWYAVWQYRQRPKAVLTCVGISAICHTGFVFMFHLAVQVFPPVNAALLGTLPEHFVIAPIGFIAQAFFPAPGGVGGGEAIFGYLYEIIRGKEAVPIGVAGRLTLRLCEWAFGFCGYIAFLRMKTQITQAEDAAESGGIPAPPIAASKE